METFTGKQLAVTLSTTVAPLLPLSTAVELIRKSAPDFEELLLMIEQQHGWLRFPHLLLRAINNLRISSYPKLYENENSLVGVGLLAFMDADDIRTVGMMFDASTLPQRGEFIDWFARHLQGVVDSIELPSSRADVKAACREFRTLSPAEKVDFILMARRFLSSIMGNFHQALSIMLYGEKLTSLVKRAKLGDRDAYLKAIQVDSRIFCEIEYFQKQYQKARLHGDAHFCDQVGRRLMAPPYRGKIRHKSLYMAFSLLDQVGWLERLSDRETLEICDEVGIGRLTGSVSGITGMGKCRRDYLEIRQLSHKATH